jgi:hypothetical protein
MLFSISVNAVVLVFAAAAGAGPKEAEPEDPKAPVMDFEGADHAAETGPAAASASVAASARKQKYFSAALKVDALVPPRDVSATVAVTVELRYILPFHDNRLSLGVEAGWYALQGSGKATDPELGEYAYAYYINNIPIFIGPAYEIPIPGLEKTPFDVFASAGFAMVISSSSGIAFESRSHANATALGWYGGAGAEFDIWIGKILGELRYTNAWTDFGLPQEGGNGDLGGINIYVGYRITI